MDLEVGMYVRTKIGIAEIYNVNDYREQQIALDFRNEKRFDDLVFINYEQLKEIQIGSSSHNLIDLVEVGDLVNNHEVLLIDETYSDATYTNKYKYLFTIIGKDVIKNEDIKSIVTHEQLESVSYKIGGNNGK